MKKIFALLLCACMLTAAVSGLAQASFAQPGTYSASAMGRNGDVTVTAVFSAESVTDIQIEDSETPTIGTAAMRQLADDLLDNQALSLDTLSGATLSCDAFIAALTDCVNQAGGEMQALYAQTSVGGAAYETVSADLIIVGAGGAGLTAAKTAAENGLSVILLEKSGVIGGNSLCSQMGINVAGGHVTQALGMTYATTELLTQAQMAFGGREELVNAYVAASGETVDWFADTLGVTFTGSTGEKVDPENPIASVGEDHPSGSDLFMVKADAQGYTANTLIVALSNAIADETITLYKNTEAVSLLQGENGEVTGVTAVASDGSEVTFTGKAVLLATGGFGMNHEMVTAYRPDLANAVTDETAPTTGDGIVMAQALGAKTVDMDQMQTFPHVPVGDTWLSPMGMPGGFRTTAIFVNQDAQRYTQEGFDPTVADTLAQAHAFVIFGADSMNDSLRQLEARGIVKQGATAQALAEQLGLDPQALAQTIETWNSACDAGEDADFGSKTLQKIAGDTLYGYAFGVGAHYMMGGLLINSDTQVLDESETPIAGLYAAGEVTGGFHGTKRIDGSGTGDAFVFGHLAGEKIAQALAE